ncbi:hypothetical protein FS749_006221 [Ceratobasidium sp. UAMH 11750]|nr:hypothetical protein FS749_006221 [Ceratobasidium sp. UAMH 11750]
MKYFHAPRAAGRTELECMANGLDAAEMTLAKWSKKTGDPPSHMAMGSLPTDGAIRGGCWPDTVKGVEDALSRWRTSTFKPVSDVVTWAPEKSGFCTGVFQRQEGKAEDLPIGRAIQHARAVEVGEHAQLEWELAQERDIEGFKTFAKRWADALGNRFERGDGSCGAGVSQGSDHMGGFVGRGSPLPRSSLLFSSSGTGQTGIQDELDLGPRRIHVEHSSVDGKDKAGDGTPREQMHRDRTPSPACGPTPTGSELGQESDGSE